MKMKWKISLLLVLLFAFFAPVYTSAVETEGDAANELEASEEVNDIEGGVEESDPIEVLPEVLLPVASHKIEETNENRTKALTKEKSLLTTEPKKVTAIPTGSTIATVFPDAEMASTIVTSLNTTSYSPTQQKRTWTVNDIITENDLLTISRILGNGEKLKSIEGIQYCTQVIEISFTANSASIDTGLDNIAPLAEAVGGYPKLETLTLRSMLKLQDLSPLSQIDGGFPKLTTFTIAVISCKDYSFLTKVVGGFPQLKNLVINTGYFKDLSVLLQIDKGLPNLVNLNLSSNKISDTSSLASFNELSQLEVLNLGSNLIDNLDFLENPSGWPNLKELLLNYNLIGNNALKSFPNVSAGFPKLERLALGQNKISDITSLTQKNFLNMKNFELTYNQISDISSLANMQFNYSIYINVSKQGILLPIINSVATNQSFTTESIDIIDELGNNQPPNTFLPYTGTYQAINSQITWPISTMITDPSYARNGYIIPYIPAHDGVSYGWNYTRNENKRNVSFSGTVYQPLNYVHFPPTITADNSQEYVENETVTEADFLTDIHATTDDGSQIDSDFETVVDKSVPGDYMVTLIASNGVGAATPVSVTVRILASLELEVPASFRMDVDANVDAIPTSDTNQTLKCYGAMGVADLKVTDRRSVKPGWTVTASMTPFTNSKGDILESPLKYQSQTLASGAVYLGTTNQPIEVKAASSQTGYITTTSDLQDRLTMDVLPNDALVDDAYEANITWTLEDAPR
ncbi:LapB repeat-containing protein [Listeria sp. FSL L7-1509]|uniref:LapB repeat-containing protein n=1 Tax=Listeria immobilis TaxID=2713502 RepID=UPI00162627F9|nr:LapB repeat-containing protein [Listeria immobilis]MBC1483931.1 LapB repeat-containing protein [Listeria immobilis]MBC1505413.1 LapB repeat-containing protein [Listeria immobilis]MBC6303897.1 LapB repeat-containing protein [Listeria immobilis]MBC6313648.1 LapB repeat-containing protein [Listeria immobilis]